MAVRRPPRSHVTALSPGTDKLRPRGVVWTFLFVIIQSATEQLGYESEFRQCPHGAQESSPDQPQRMS